MRCMLRLQNTVLFEHCWAMAQSSSTAKYTPELNGVSERMNRTLIEKARCMISDGNLDEALWAEAVQHAAFIINRSVNRSLSNRCPEEIWSGRKPDLSSLKIVGNPAMVLLPKIMRKKWDLKSSRNAVHRTFRYIISILLAKDQACHRRSERSKEAVFRAGVWQFVNSTLQ